MPVSRAPQNAQTILSDGAKVDSGTKSVVVSGVDGDGRAQILATNSDGNIDVSQSDLFTVMNDMLKELKKVNFHLMVMTDSNIANQDVEV